MFYLDKLQYVNIEVTSANLDSFWLQGSARISQFQQIDFLSRFYQSKLPISKRAQTIVKEMIVLKKTETYILRGKTGWSIVNETNNGWFVGYIEKGDETFFFATNVEPSGKFIQKEFQENRKAVTYRAFQQLNIVL